MAQSNSEFPYVPFVPGGPPLSPFRIDYKEIKENKLEEDILIFSTNFINGLKLHFREYSQGAGQIARDDVEAHLVEPILTYIKDNRKSKRNEVNKVVFDTIAHAAQCIQNFEDFYRSKLKTNIADQLYKGLVDLQNRLYTYLETSFPEQTQQYDRQISDAVRDIRSAKLKQCYDLLCIACCAGWCPIQYTLTLCNCYMGTLADDDRPGEEQVICPNGVRECAPPNIPISICAPGRSMMTYYDDFRRNSRQIENKKRDAEKSAISSHGLIATYIRTIEIHIVEDQKDPLFPGPFISGIGIHFDKFSSGAGEMNEQAKRRLLYPILHNMRNLDEKKESIEVKLNELIQLISLQIREFQEEEQGIFSSKVATQLQLGLNDLQRRVFAYINTAFPVYTSQHNMDIHTAKTEIYEARLERCCDLLCIACCVGWCPFQYILTLCNCFGGCPEQGQRCQEITPPEQKTGYCAPVRTINSLFKNFKRAGQFIDQQNQPDAPAQQLMF